ncbi:hypothetical protein ACJJH9_07005 [Microbulbifer sp. DLAB2-AF]|uniref:hypothetical protein n=1 Tax=Microbulbifer sp. DLAB2-AF TaxID=3243395 RepID=UPI00403A4F98
MEPQEINVGIDTSSKQLDIYVRPNGQFFSVTNNKEGIKDAINQLQPLKPQRVLIESTGRLESATTRIAGGMVKAPRGG